MKKQSYLTPELEVILFKPEGNLLTGSETGLNATDVEALELIAGEWVL